MKKGYYLWEGQILTIHSITDRLFQYTLNNDGRISYKVASMCSISKFYSAVKITCCAIEEAKELYPEEFI